MPSDVASLKTRWRVFCEGCPWLEVGKSREECIRLGRDHVAAHQDEDEWGFRVQGFSPPPVAEDVAAETVVRLILAKLWPNCPAEDVAAAAGVDPRALKPALQRLAAR